MKLLSLASIVLLLGCTTTTGVVPIGKDTYMVSGSGKSPGGYSGSDVKAAAFKEATAYCAGLGKHLQILHTDQRDMSFGKNATAELQFMCLDSSDTELTRPRLTKEADQVIEVRKDIKIKDTTSAPSRDVYGELIKLDDLRKRGILTEAEFETQKKALLRGK